MLQTTSFTIIFHTPLSVNGVINVLLKKLNITVLKCLCVASVFRRFEAQNNTS